MANLTPNEYFKIEGPIRSSRLRYQETDSFDDKTGKDIPASVDFVGQNDRVIFLSMNKKGEVRIMTFKIVNKEGTITKPEDVIDSIKNDSDFPGADITDYVKKILGKKYEDILTEDPTKADQFITKHVTNYNGVSKVYFVKNIEIIQTPWDPNVVPTQPTGPPPVENKIVTTTEPTVATSSVGPSASNVDDSNVGASASNVGATASILGEFTFNVEQDNTFIGVNNQFGTLYTIGIGEIKEEPIDKPEEGELLPEEGLDEEYSEDIFMGDEELKQTFDAYITQISENQNITPAEKVEIAKEIVAYKPGKPAKTPPADITKAMKDYGIKTALEKAHFLAQCAHESGEFAWKREFASGKAYEGRKDLGNTQTGDGVKYKGRGYIQITGRANYTAYNKYLKEKGINDDVVTNPTLLEGKFAADCSVWYWVVLGPPNNKNFTKKANEGATEAIVTKISRWVNGGDNGLADRKTKFNFYWSILDKNPNSYS